MTEATFNALAAIKNLAGKYPAFTSHPECHDLDVLKGREIIRGAFVGFSLPVSGSW